MSAADPPDVATRARLRCASVPLVVFAFALATLPALLPNAYYADVAIRVAINATLAIALNLLIGYTGQISLGHAAFFGLGRLWLGDPHRPSRLAARRRARGERRRDRRSRLCLRARDPSPRGPLPRDGDARRRRHRDDRAHQRDRADRRPRRHVGRPISLFLALRYPARDTGTGCSRRSSSRRSWLAGNLVDSPAGRALRALHGSQTAARAARRRRRLVQGARLRRSRRSSTAVMGSLYAHYVGFVTPSLAAFPKSIELVTMVVVGGMASIWGSVAGAALLSLAARTARPLRGLRDDRCSALILVATMILLPRGIVPSLAARAHARGRLIMLRVENLTKSFGGVAAVSDVSFDVGEGAIHAVIGPNGAGKTTLFNLITGVYRADLRLDRARAARRSPGLPPEALARRGVARTFQNLQIGDESLGASRTSCSARISGSIRAFSPRWRAGPGSPRPTGGARGGGRADGLRRLRRLCRRRRARRCPTAR